tara:strand:+ start:1849 stop:2826 length:978 start_codon:yes stop_codon:yes gene_type:complete
VKNNIPEEEYRLWKTINLWPSFTKQLIKNPLLDILQKGQPHIRFQVARDALGLPIKHPLVNIINLTLHYQKKYKKILNDEIKYTISDSAMQNELNFIFLMEKLHCLVSFGGYKNMKGINELIIDVMDFQKPDGRFPGLYHHHAKMCGLLVRLGLQGNRLLDRSFNWIIERQRNDGGWLHRSMVLKGKTIKTQKSCIWTSVEILYALSMRRSIVKSKSVEKGIKFLEKQLFNKNSTKFLEHLSPWDYFSVGSKSETLFTGGSLKVLEILVNYGLTRKDKIVDRLASGILQTQLETGYFPFQKSKAPKPDPYVTVRFLKILRLLSQK